MAIDYVPPQTENWDDLDALKFTSETNRALHKQRQIYEFRVVFTTLTFYVLATSAVLTNKASLARAASLSSAVWIIFVLIAALASVHLFRLHRGNRINLDVAKNAELAIIALLANKAIHILPGYLSPDRVMRMRRCEPNWICQTGMMFLFAVAAALITTSVLAGNVGH